MIKKINLSEKLSLTVNMGLGYLVKSMFSRLGSAVATFKRI